MAEEFVSKPVRVNIISVPTEEDWLNAKRLAYRTIGKDTDKVPNEKWKEMIIRSEHSPIRSLIVKWEWLDIPYWVTTHFVRHKIGIEHYVRSQRNDRQSDYDRRLAPQGALVDYTCVANLQAIINISKVRLCNNASGETKHAWSLFLQHLKAEVPEIYPYCQPSCVYRGGICPEPKCCGWNSSSAGVVKLNNYKKLF